jgi:hypothetical protein
MVLQAFVAPDFDADKHKVALLDVSECAVVTRGSDEHLDLAEERTGRVRTEYISKGDEKLEDVAKKYGMGSHDLARINRISYNTVLAKGQKIIVYQVADPSRSERAEEQWKKTPKSKRAKTASQRPKTTSSADGEDKPPLPPEEATPAKDDKPAKNDKSADGPITRPGQLQGDER